MLPAAALAVLLSSAAPPCPAAPVAIYADFQRPCPEETFRTMRAELAAIMAPAGLALDWRTARDPCNSRPAAAVVVLEVRGCCCMKASSPAAAESGALGWTHVGDGAVLPFSGIDCDRVRRHIQPLVTGAAPARRQALLGRALARVLAHEMYHVLARTLRHGTTGIAKPVHSAAELLSSSFAFDDLDCRTLRSAAAQ